MDKRKALEPNTILNFPLMPCTIKTVLGKGSNAIAYTAEYPDLQQPGLWHPILVKELFPLQEDGLIYRREDGCIFYDPAVSEEAGMHRLSFQRASQMQLKLKQLHPDLVDENINTFEFHHTLYTVMGFSGGRIFTAEKSLLLLTRRIQKVLQELELFHAAGYLHLDISPDNVLLIGNGARERISLIDYNSVHTIDEIRKLENVYFSVKKGYTAPEILKGRVAEIDGRADLYSVAALFFFGLMNRNRTAYEMIHPNYQKVSDSGCLTNQPATVVSMVKKILQKGLASIPRQRYSSTEEMQKDMEELIDRIEGRGITHWALWEAGHTQVKRVIRDNPSYHYLQEMEQLYPVLFQKQGQETIELGQMMERMYDVQHPICLEGMGGIGKTTTVLRMMLSQKQQYLTEEPAFQYISLFGWNRSGTDYIQKRMLENLLFKPETDSYSMAKHELEVLLATPLYTRFGVRPKVVLFLDGFNEASGDTTELIREIETWNAYPGVKIVLTSRSDAGFSDYAHYSICQLDEAAVTSVLSRNGMLPPEDAAVFAVLRTPMMLSIFVQTVKNSGKQFFMESEKELLSNYLESLVKKQMAGMSEAAEEYWMVDAAVYYVFPYLAKLLASENRVLSDAQLFLEVKKRYKDLKKKKRDMTKVYPKWIGHMAAIKGEAAGADEWYGQIVHEILWRRLGLLVREPVGTDDGAYGYRLVHQVLEDYMVGYCRKLDQAFARLRRQKMIVPTVAALLLIGLQLRYDYVSEICNMVFQTQNPYDKDLADVVLSQENSGYVILVKQHETLEVLLDSLLTENTYETAQMQAFQRANQESSISVSQTRLDTGIENLLATGEVMPWSQKSLDQEAVDRYLSFIESRTEGYLTCAEVLEKLWADDGLREQYGAEYVEQFSDVIAADTDVNLVYFRVLIQPELDGMKETDREKWAVYEKLLKEYATYKTDQDLSDMTELEVQELADDAWKALQYTKEKVSYMLGRG